MAIPRENTPPEILGMQVKLGSRKTWSGRIYFLTMGWVVGLIWWSLAFLLAITVVGFPFGVGMFKFGRLACWPFYAEVWHKPKYASPFHNWKCGCICLLWAPLGLSIFLLHMIFILFCFVIPWFWPFIEIHWMLGCLALWPVGAHVRYPKKEITDDVVTQNEVTQGMVRPGTEFQPLEPHIVNAPEVGLG